MKKKSMKDIMKQPSRTDWVRLKAMTDNDIDFSDIPPMGDDFFKNAVWWIPPRKSAITIRIDPDILEWFKKKGRGYQTRINAVLRMYVEARKAAK
jgi:uncharacterized protein (DUF4415 family)